MTIRITDAKAVARGAVFLALGVFAIVVGHSYPLGSLTSMGPGYFPLLVSLLLIGLGSLFAADEFQGSEKPLLVGLGKGISGKSHFVNVAKMPHLLIAGATGSGKSVTIHALIVSLLYRNSPQMLKFIMIDPKRVELTLYNKIPHLLTPVITDAKKAILSLKWAAKEMDRRYNILQKIAYLSVLFVLLPGVVLTGLTMSPAMDAAWPWLPALFGGRPSARSIHFLCAMGFVLFIAVHLLMVVLAGPFNEVRSMLTGRYRLPREKGE